MRAPEAQSQAGDVKSPALTSADYDSDMRPAGVGDIQAPAPASICKTAAVKPAAVEESAAVSRGAVEAKLLAYIHPGRIQTPEQREAFDAAVEAQYTYERGEAEIELPRGVASLTVGSYSVRRVGSGDVTGSPSGICPEALAFLYNAGLLKHEWPVAKPI